MMQMLTDLKIILNYFFSLEAWLNFWSIGCILMNSTYIFFTWKLKSTNLNEDSFWTHMHPVASLTHTYFYLYWLSLSPHDSPPLIHAVNQFDSLWFLWLHLKHIRSSDFQWLSIDWPLLPSEAQFLKKIVKKKKEIVHNWNSFKTLY